MSISLTNTDMLLTSKLHSLDEDFISTNPAAHTKTGRDVVMIYLILSGKNFGLDVPLLRDVSLAYKIDENVLNYYSYLQHEFRTGDLDCLGWVYADEVDINKLIRKEEK